jgi:hypothetical protein
MRASLVTLIQILSQIAETAPYFSKFEGLWPVHDMIAGYLLNAQTRRRKDLRLERLADGGDTGGDEGDDEMTVGGNGETEDEEMGPVMKRKGSRRVSFRLDSDSDDDMEVREYVRV